MVYFNEFYLLAKGIGLNIAFLILLFVPMERVFPAKKNQRFFRPEWFLDFTYFVGQYLFWHGAVLWGLNYFNSYLTFIISENTRQFLSSQSIIIQSIEVVFLSDLIIYWAHRFQHKVDFLWRFHKVHHSSKHLDWLAAYREHPMDSIYTIGLINLPAFILGFSLESLAVVVVFRGVWAIYIHSNVKFSLGFIKKIIGSPELHHWHHTKDRDVGNYANVSPLMDLLFGTYVCPELEPDDYGINEPFPTTYIGQLIVPLIPKFLRK